MTDQPLPLYHDPPKRFRDALHFTETERGFAARLIEKDYYCSFVLRDLLPLCDAGLTFKGGTSLSKVHAGFYRLSEDLDFVIHIDSGASRSVRRELIAPVKAHIAGLAPRLPFLRESGFRAHNQSMQYIGTLHYRSCLTGDEESIKIEIGLREPIIEAPQRSAAETMLIDPLRAEPALPPVPVQTLSLAETYAEKIRAALSRTAPAIRDFFDLDYAVRNDVLALDDPSFIQLVAAKLQVSGADAIDLSESRLDALRNQLLPQLRPVLRQADFDAFDLDRAFQLVVGLKSRLP